MTTRRTFVLYAAALPLFVLGGASAQLNKPLPLIGVLSQSPAQGVQYQAFLEALRDLGYAEGKNVTIAYVFGPDAKLAELAEQLIQKNPKVIFAPTPAAALAVKKATSAIPIVFSVIGDPVKTALAASLARPGGNATGMTALGSDLGGKRLELLKELLPKLTRVAVLWNPAVPDKVLELKNLAGAARTLRLTVQPVEVRSPADFDNAFATIKRLRPGAFVALAEPLAFSQLKRMAEFANATHIPFMSAWREATQLGGLMAYGPDIVDLYRRSATYVDKILKGIRPADLPIEEPARFDSAINRKTAKALGLSIPQSLLVQATEVIE
jgi:putative ABC transport system substrate-binding protein